MHKDLWNEAKIKIEASGKSAGTELVFTRKSAFGDGSPSGRSLKDFEMLTARGYKGNGSFYAQANNILYMGFDDTSAYFQEHMAYGQAAFKAVRLLKELKIKEAFCDVRGLDDACKRQVIRGLFLGDYSYKGFKKEEGDCSSGKDSSECDILRISLNGISDSLLHELSVICRRVNFVRDVVNTPPNIADSVFLSNLAKEEAIKLGGANSDCRIDVSLHDNSFLEEQGMGAFLAVNRASSSPAFLAHLSYKPSAPTTKKIAIVGKGLVYDTGGLSLKPAEHMTTMKADKGGACAILGIFLAVAELGLPVELHAIMGITDNAIGNKSYRPDDVLISREKKSIEVKNTDAEGRLVLVDCLSYAQDLKPDLIIDFATLTGACVVALGEYTSGVMGFNEELKQRFVESALRSGELAHTLPFNEHLSKLLESKIADVSNISSSRYGGAMTAGIFLSEFVRKEYRDKWLHVDIAGPAYVEKEWGVNPHGASGVGVFSCLDFISSIL